MPFKIPSEHDHELQFANTPNILTLVRMLMVPLVVAALMAQQPHWDIVAGVCFSLAAITDYFDGYVARVQGLVTIYGKLMDPLADKFLVVCSVIMLQQLDRIPAVVTMLLVCRELAITGLRALASAEGVVIEASPGGKWKTATQMVAIPFIMAKEGLFGIPLYPIGQVLLYVSLALSLWSAKVYVRDFFRTLRSQRLEKVRLKKLALNARKDSRKARLEAKALKLQQRKNKAAPDEDAAP